MPNNRADRRRPLAGAATRAHSLFVSDHISIRRHNGLSVRGIESYVAFAGREWVLYPPMANETAQDVIHTGPHKSFTVGCAGYYQNRPVGFGRKLIATYPNIFFPLRAKQAHCATSAASPVGVTTRRPG
ncbi:hypothetical protein EVAR_49648_1 [Eumeta japonica]|uniref:Uncharacterized protein n=1 Tax=Eumeta variegata TaxID=151549 RepID=A0A4C1Y9P5_EUMVA|nr:hypothetical protein EVAR_49648_1 [Eumeta japonica]